MQAQKYEQLNNKNKMNLSKIKFKIVLKSSILIMSGKTTARSQSSLPLAEPKADKFMNLLMIHGKKTKAYNIFYKSLRFIETKNFTNLLHTKPVGSARQTMTLSRNLIFKAIENIKPSVEVRKVRKGGITYQVPALIPEKRQESLAIRWIIHAAKHRKKNSKLTFAECLALELIEASKKLGKPRQKRDELHKLAESNRAYIRFRWW